MWTFESSLSIYTFYRCYLNNQNIEDDSVPYMTYNGYHLVERICPGRPSYFTLIFGQEKLKCYQILPCSRFSRIRHSLTGLGCQINFLKTNNSQIILCLTRSCSWQNQNVELSCLENKTLFFHVLFCFFSSWKPRANKTEM